MQEFTKEMKQTHTILIPSMLPIHFQFLKQILINAGYKVEVLQTENTNIVEEGLRYVHNDTCYPALIVIGQMIQALKSGKYDKDHVALAITQTGGGCRASNYIHLLRKALVQAGFENVPVISANASHLEKNSGFHFTVKMIWQIVYAFLYGDILVWLRNQCQPYETCKDDTKQVVDSWIHKLNEQFDSFQYMHLTKNFKEMIQDFSNIKRTNSPKIKVGIVGEIYMKYSPLGNNHLEEYLISEGCEPVVSGVLDFALYCLENVSIDHEYYQRNKHIYGFARIASKYIQHLQNKAISIMKKDGTFRCPDPFKELKECSKDMIDQGVKMGEGWLLTSEMVSLIQHDVNNIVCCQPFGCLPNHIVAKGMMRKVKNQYPMANVALIDYDPSATRVNQENRIKLMLSNAKLMENLSKVHK